MIDFESYAKIKNNYCICYFGQCDEYLVLLEALKPFIEKSFSGLNFFIGCKDESYHVFSNKENVLPISLLKEKKSNFAHIKELTCDGNSNGHPIDNFLKESGVKNIQLKSSGYEKTKKATIVQSGFYPTNPINERQTKYAKKIAMDQGFEVDISLNTDHSGLVFGVESLGLAKACIAGIPVYLFDTGIGSSFYKELFPNIKILNI